MSFPRSYSVNSGGSGNLSGCYFTRLNCTFRRYLTSPLWRGVTRLLNRCPSPWILFYVRRCNFTTKRHTFTLVSTCHFVAIQFFSHCIKKNSATVCSLTPRTKPLIGIVYCCVTLQVKLQRGTPVTNGFYGLPVNATRCEASTQNLSATLFFAAWAHASSSSVFVIEFADIAQSRLT